MNPNLDYPKIGLLVFYVVNEKKILFSVSPPLQSGNFFFTKLSFVPMPSARPKTFWPTKIKFWLAKNNLAGQKHQNPIQK